MKVFIEKAAGLNQVKSNDANRVMRDYPYPYGYILHTTSGDGENVDCYVVTKRKLVVGTVVDAEPIGFFEQIEDGQEDHKVLTKLENESVTIDDTVKANIIEFHTHFFDHRPEKVVQMGNFFGKDKAEEYIRNCKN